MKLIQRAVGLALEAETDGKARIEREMVFYCKVKDFSFLGHAVHTEFQEQWQIKVPKTDENSGSARIRSRYSVGLDGVKSYVLTSKLKMESGESEVEIPSSPDSHHHFKVISDQGMRKVRYVFPIGDSELNFEVDVYFNSKDADENTPRTDETFSPWVKVDIEVPEGSKLDATIGEDGTTISLNFPFQFEKIITKAMAEKDNAIQVLMNSLYDDVFLLKNQATA